MTVLKVDGNLYDGKSGVPDLVGHLDLKGESVGADAVEVECPEHLAPIALEAAGRVRERKARDEPDVETRRPAEDQPLYTPVAQLRSAHIA